MLNVLVFLLLLNVVYSYVNFKSMSRMMSPKLYAGEMSKSLPFLIKPAALDGKMIGDYGFDPLGFSDQFSLKYMREVELKHGRVAMLATVGFLFQQFIHLPGAAYQESNPFLAVTTVGLGVNMQILIGAGIVELVYWRKYYDEDSVPGDLGWDPAKVLKGKSDDYITDLKLKELKNGRLAMIAIMGMFVQYSQFGHLI